MESLHIRTTSPSESSTAAQQGRRTAFIAALAGTILLLQWLLFSGAAGWSMLLAMLGFACASRQMSGKVPALVLLLCWCTLGCALASAHLRFPTAKEENTSRRLLERGRRQMLCGRVEGMSSSRQLTLLLRLDPAAGSAATLSNAAEILVAVRAAVHRLGHSLPQRGDYICALLRLQSHPQAGRARGYHSWLRRQGVSLSAQLLALQSGAPQKTEPLSLLTRVPGLQSSTLLYAAVLGRRDLLSEALWDLFKHFGLSHLLVISGFHLGVVLCAAAYCLRRMCTWTLRPLRWASARSIALSGGVLAVWLYTFYLPGAVPLYRAAIAGSLALLTLGQMRRLLPIRSLLLALVAVHVLEPAALMDVGPQLTFAALLGLWLGRRIDLVLGPSRFPWLRSLLLLSAAASSATAPLSCFYFGMWVPAAALFSACASPVFSLFVLLPGAVLLFAEQLLGLRLPLVLWQTYLELLEWGIALLFRLEEWLFDAGILAFQFEPGHWGPLLLSLLPLLLWITLLFRLERGGGEPR